MKNFKSIFSIFFAMVILFSASNPALAYDKITIINNSGRDIYWAYLSPTGQGWGSDRLGRAVWEPGDIVFLEVPLMRYWDLKVVFSNDNYWAWYEIDTQNYGFFSIRSNGKLVYE